MPSRVSGKSTFEMEKQYSKRIQPRMPLSYEEHNVTQDESMLHSTNRQSTRSLHSPPPLIPNAGYYNNQKFASRYLKSKKAMTDVIFG